MKVSRLPARPWAQRQAENERYHARVRTAGLVQLSIVPVDKVPCSKALAVEWRSKARALLETDLPTADQIPQIHAVRRALLDHRPSLQSAGGDHRRITLIDHEKRLLGAISTTCPGANFDVFE